MLRLLLAVSVSLALPQMGGAADKDVTSTTIPGLPITYGQAVEEGVRAILPQDIPGAKLDKVACHSVVLDSRGVKQVHFRARYRVVVGGIATPAVESLYVKYD